MEGFDPVKWLSSALQIWERGSLFLWALATAALLALLALVGFSIFKPAPGIATLMLWVSIGFVVLVVLAGFKTYQERTVRTLVFVIDDMQSFWHHAPQPDGRELTQIALRGRVTNVTKQPIYPTEIRLLSPCKGRVRQKNIFTEHEGGRVYGSDNAVGPGTRAGFSAHFFVDGFLGKSGKPMTIVVSISDQLGHWHRVTFRDLRAPEDH